jgi:hypothetical protein
LEYKSIGRPREISFNNSFGDEKQMSPTKLVLKHKLDKIEPFIASTKNLQEHILLMK